MTELREKLSSEALECAWEMLAMHYRRDALFVVAAELSLVDAAVAVAKDDGEAVKAWIAKGTIARPTSAQVAAWEQEEGPRFTAVIVQPLVLAQRRSE